MCTCSILRFHSRYELSTITDEELYYLKFTNLMLRLAPRAMRVLFDKKFPPDQLCSRLNQYKHVLQHLTKKNVIFNFHWEEVMFPPSGNSIECNISLR